MGHININPSIADVTVRAVGTAFEDLVESIGRHNLSDPVSIAAIEGLAASLRLPSVEIQGNTFGV